VIGRSSYLYQKNWRPSGGGQAETKKAFGSSADNGQKTNLTDDKAILRSYSFVEAAHLYSSRAKQKVTAKRRFRLSGTPSGWNVDLNGVLRGILTTTDIITDLSVHPFATVVADAQIRSSDGHTTQCIEFDVTREKGDAVYGIEIVAGSTPAHSGTLRKTDSEKLPAGDYEVNASLVTHAGIDGLFGSQKAAKADFFTQSLPITNVSGQTLTKVNLGWEVNISATPRAIFPITATAEGSQTPGVDDPPFTTDDPMVENEDFTITPDGFDPGHRLPLGDGVNEGTSWSFDFAEDPSFQFFSTSLPLASALLTLELTPKGSGISTDAFKINLIGFPPIITPVIQELPIGVTSTIQIELTNFYRNRALPDLLKATHGDSIPAFYADDAIVSFAELTLTSFPGEKVNDKFPDLGPEDVDTHFDATPCAENCVGTFTITAEFKNTSLDTLSDLFFEVGDLTGGNVLCNADGGVPWGYGADFTAPMDGVLKPQESFTVVFEIGLRSMKPFIFEVDLFGKVQK